MELTTIIFLEKDMYHFTMEVNNSIKALNYKQVYPHMFQKEALVYALCMSQMNSEGIL